MDKVQQYRGDMLLRETWTNRAGLLLAEANVQALMHVVHAARRPAI